MVAYSFNANQVEPRYGSGPSLPLGKYKGVIVTEEQVPTKKGDGGMLVFGIQVIEGQFNGVKTVDRLNLWNPNPQAVDIANKQLAAYCHVTGQFVLQDTVQLHNHPFMFEMGPQKDSEYTQIVAIFDINGNAPGKSGGAQAQQPAIPMQAPQQPQQPQGSFAPPQAQQPAPQAWQQPQAAQPAPQGWQQPQQAPQPAPQAQGGWQPPQQGGAPAAPSWANR